MVAMTATTGSFSFQHGRPFTVHDLEALPDDGYRYELIDGLLLVSPAPSTNHQIVVIELAARLRERCPAEMRTFVAPFAVRPSATIELQPDVLVARKADLTERDLPVAPLLVVEVLSPSTKLVDLNTKKAAYQRLGVPSYWVIDPIDPCLTVFELDGNDFQYEKVAEIKGNKAYDATQPFPIRIVPAELLD